MSIQTIYVEKDVQDHPKTQKILKRYKNALAIPIQRYTEIFNKHGQNFRIQKERPALILAKKHGKKLHPIPKTYTIGSKLNAYFSHMLNCPFDCSYCFLQGMYRSAHYVLFVNFEDFKKDLMEDISLLKEKKTYFSGYDADSLALEPISEFAQDMIPFFQKHSLAELEIRTKSIFIRPFLSIKPTKNIIVAFTLSPENVAEAIEKKPLL